MQAMIHTHYGMPEVLAVKEVGTPSPKPNQVLVRVQAAAVNPSDWYLLRGEPFLIRPQAGLRRPKHRTLGADIAGVIAAVGRDITAFKPGDAVFGDNSGSGRGGFAEFVAMPAAALTSKPANVAWEAAAAVPMAGVTALQGLRTHGRIRAGQKVLINGASGGVGTFAVQIAAALDAQVTAVCSTGKMEMVRSLGAHHVIDYTQEDFTARPEQYDLIFDTVGNHTVAAYRRVLSSNGRFVTTQFLPALSVLTPWFALTSRQTMRNMIAQPNQDDLALLAELLTAGKLTPVIDRRYPLHALPDALHYVGQGHAKGKVIITVGADQN